METDPEEKRTSLNGVFKYFGILMAVVYVAFGLGIIFNPNDIFRKIPPQYSLPLGILMIAYGVYRGFRVIQNIFTR
jgi:hypothetical protein